MTDRAMDLGTLPVPPRRTAGTVLRSLPAAPTGCLLATAAAVTLVAVPSLHVDGWRLVLLGIVALAATVLSWPVHHATITSLGSARLGPELLGTVAVLASGLAAFDAVLRDRTSATAVTAVVVALMTVTAVWVRGNTRFLDSPAWFSVAAIGAAAVAGIAWWLARDADAGRDAATAVLVAASPGALVAAGPLALAATRRQVRDDGVSLSDTEAVLAVEDVDTVVLDKDGTITTGDLTVVAVDPVEPDHDRNLRWFAGALEHASDHRIGRAIASLAGRGRLSQVEQRPGQGITGSVDRHPVRIGDPTWLGIQTLPQLWTTVGVEVDSRVLGTITVADDVRDDAADGVRALKALGLDVVLVSHDRADRTHEVATRADIEQVHAELSGSAADHVVDALVADGHRVAVAGTTAGAAVLDVDDLGLADRAVARLARAVSAARAATSRGRLARRVALVLGGIGVGIGASGLLLPWMAAVVAGVTLAAVAVVATTTSS